MLRNLPCNLRTNLTPGARVQEVCGGEGTWRLDIPCGPSNCYRLAQLDDYASLPRRALPWTPPLCLSLSARASSPTIPGTWGFGLWNDPFGMGLLSGSGGVRLPTLPNAAWFFFASPANHLSLRDDLPASGWLAATFRSPLWPSALSILSAPILPMLLLPPIARFVRRLASHFVHQDTASLSINPTAWHFYELTWETKGVEFRVNGEVMLQTRVSPSGPLGLVIWVDNQYASVPRTGRLRYGFLPSPEPAWIEIRELSIAPI